MNFTLDGDPLACATAPEGDPLGCATPEYAAF